MRKTVVGVMGSSAGTLDAESETHVSDLARRLGREIASHGLVLMTGETSGLPYLVADSARQNGGLTVGLAGSPSESEHRDKFPELPDASDIVIYSGFGLKGRNVVSVRSSDIVVIISGSIGTLNEFTIAYDEGKIIGLMSGTGGVADLIPDLLKSIKKPTKACILSDADPGVLIDKCLSKLRNG